MSGQRSVEVRVSRNDDPNVETFSDGIIETRKSNKNNKNENKINDNNAMKDDDDEQYEDYFSAHSHRTKTSGNTLNDLFDEFHLSEAQIAAEIQCELSDERADLREKFALKYYKKWYNLLSVGFNVILYGVGSKICLMENFADIFLYDEHHLVIHGFFPDINVKHIINCINEAMDGTNTEESHFLEDLRDSDIELYIMIHSIDRLCNDNERVKEFLYQMVTKCANVHIMASADHVNSGLLWSSNHIHQFNWLWFNVPTFDSYTVERAYQSSGSSKRATASTSLTQSLTLSSIEHVYDSLTSNAQQIFLLIIRYYLNNPDTSEGFPFTDCYRHCREEFLVNSEVTLSAQLSEFKDHKLMRLKKGSDGGDAIQLLMDRQLAQRFHDKRHVN